MGTSYVEACRREFTSLVQDERSVAEFLKLSRYTCSLVLNDYDRNIRFEEGLRYDLRVLIALQREWVFVVLVDKEKLTEEAKCTEC